MPDKPLPYRVLVTGANGQVARVLRQIAPIYPMFTFDFVDRDTMNICDAAAVEQHISSKPYFACINTAAYTAVDAAEANAATAESINHIAAAKLAAVCATHNTLLLHLSSDYVYHNGLTRPLLETDSTKPQSVYAMSKLRGDLAVLAASNRFLVIRTSWLYAVQGNNFVNTMLSLGNHRAELNIVNDQWGTPTYVPHLATALLTILIRHTEQPTTNYGGIYNYSNEGFTQWAMFATLIFIKANMTTCKVNPIPSSGYPTAATRPPYSVLDKSKIKTTFALEIPTWEEGLENYFRDKK